MQLQEEMLMINLTGKSVFVKTQEEYEHILSIAKKVFLTREEAENKLEEMKEK